MGPVLFDLEYLEKLSYDRSKIWSTLLENVVEKETLNEIDINNVEEIFVPGDERESVDELASMEDNESDNATLDTKALQNISNATRISLFFNKPLSPGESRNDEENQLIDIFNQTLPIINEHNRQLKEAGFDKILSSFNRKAIEDKVGSWLSRHNSLFGGHDASLCTDAENNDLKIAVCSPRTSCRDHSRIVNKSSNDSDDSLQSGETARYIRSSKSSTIKKSTSTTTMIKTFRKVRSTQEAPNEKFDVRHLRRISKDYYDLTRLRSPSNYKMRQLSSQKSRTKVFRKRACSYNYSAMDSSSDSDCYNVSPRFHKRKLKPCCSKHQCSPAVYNTPQIPITTLTKLLKRRRCTSEVISKRRNRMLYCLHAKANSSSTLSSSNSFGSVCEKRRAMKKNSKFFNDKRPCKRESECNCCSKRKLCEKYKHLADTSTDEWFVENCSPKKHSVVTKNLHGNSKTKNSLKANKEPNKSPIRNEETTVKDEILTSDEDWQLQMAIKESKELYEKEQKRKQNKSKKEQYKTLPTRVLRKTPRKQEFLDLKQSKQNNVVIEKILPTLVEDKNNEKIDIVNLVDDTSWPTQNNANTFLTNTTEETFLTAPQTRAICNSTALSRSSQAYNRQITDIKENKEKSKNETEVGSMKPSIKKSRKRTTEKKYTSPTILKDKGQKVAPVYTVTSTTVRSPEVDSTLTVRKSNNEINGSGHGSDHNDCAQVTSTTNIELPLPVTITENVEDKRPPSSNSNWNRQSTLQRYLIYAPDNRNVSSAQSFSNDGYFTIGKEHLSSVIGEKSAKKFLKYYVGRKRFNNNSTVYYRPPATRILSDKNNSTSSSSTDELDNVGQYGDLYESLSKAD